MAETKRVIYYDQLDNNRPTSGDVIFVDNPTTGTHKMDLKSFVDMINNGFDSSIKSSGVSVSADNYSSIITNVNDQPVNSIYTYGAGLQSHITNLPSNKAMTIVNLAQKSTGGLGQAMLAIERNGSGDYLYFRTIGGSPAVWSSWVKVANSADVESVREALDDLDIETDKTLTISDKPADAKATGDAINDLKADLSDIFIRQFVEKNIANIDNVVKLSEYSFGPAAGTSKVSGSPNASYDSYYFYTSKDTAMYFANAAPSTPAYISLTVGYNPSKTWDTIGGQMQMSCQNATRKRKSENNLPTSAAQMDVSEAIVILTVNASTTTSFYINSNISLSGDIGLPLEQTIGQSTTKAMSQKAVTEAISGKKPMVKYTSGGSGFDGIEHVDIYIPTFDGYIDYWFAHNKNIETNSDIWRINAAYMVDDSLANPVAFTTTGEWEIAIRLEGRSDFSGGYIHGDEVYTDIVFIIDGAVVDITDYMTATPFESLCILQKSNMYDPNDSTTVFGVHTSEHSFSKGTDKIQINQSLLWSGNYTLGYSYMGMFPIAQTVSDCWYSNKDYLPESISNGYREGITKAVLLKESTKTIGQFISEQLPTLNSKANKSFNITDNGGTSYNKCYYILCGNDGTASSGDLWESKTIYALSKGV